ncbi:hypothetical protein EDD21DRAFT_382864 [Dissophora ornata]|nr:hypothetical protein EDD21DRAFT_382864 [Dissophora ornata]
MDSFDSPTSRFVPDALETLSLFVSLTSISIMSLLFGRKTAGTKLRSINYARGLVIGLYVVSWLFSFSAALLVQTNDFNPVSCEISVFFCIFLYASSKILIYLFLIERVHIVTAVGIARWNCPTFRFNMALLLPYSSMVVLAILYRVSVVSDDGICKIGLLKQSALPLIAYDFLLSAWLTALFLRSLISSTSMLQGPTKSKLREVARRALFGSTMAMILSTANISTFLYFQGHERGLICLALCTLDVTLNAITIHWVTSRANSNNNRGASDRTSTAARGGGQPFPLHGTDKQVSPLESHISVSIESYVEDYHQMNLASRVPDEPLFQIRQPVQ